MSTGRQYPKPLWPMAAEPTSGMLPLPYAMLFAITCTTAISAITYQVHPTTTPISEQVTRVVFLPAGKPPVQAPRPAAALLSPSNTADARKRQHEMRPQIPVAASTEPNQAPPNQAQPTDNTPSSQTDTQPTVEATTNLPPKESTALHTDIGILCPTQVKPEIPRRAIIDGIGGVVRARAVVTHGAIQEVTLLSGPKVFYAAVRHAILQYKCAPSSQPSVTAEQEFVFEVH